MSCIYDDSICKYYEEGRCDFPSMGSGYPYDSPCFTGKDNGEWIPVKMNHRFVKCSECQFMVNKHIVYDYTEKNPLVYKYCPSCGADMRGAVNDG